MKLKYTCYRKAVEGNTGKAGFSGWTYYSTSAKSRSGLVKKMKDEAEKALARTIDFYEKYPFARELDIFDEKHVWFFETYAPFNGDVLRFRAFAICENGEYGEMETVSYAGHDDLDHFQSRCNYYSNLVSHD